MKTGLTNSPTSDSLPGMGQEDSSKSCSLTETGQTDSSLTDPGKTDSSNSDSLRETGPAGSLQTDSWVEMG